MDVEFGWRLALRVALGANFLSPSAAFAARVHGLSIFGDLKYPADFKHFDYVNPDAPKGGEIITIGTGARDTFDSFNEFIISGTPAQGLWINEGLSLPFDSLMVRAFDEPDAVYGLIAREAEVAADGSSATFWLRPEAKFSDGSPLTAADVVFTFETIKSKGHPRFSSGLKDVASAQAIDDHTVKFTFQGKQLRDLPLVVATLPILSRSWYASP